MGVCEMETDGNVHTLETSRLNKDSCSQKQQECRTATSSCALLLSKSRHNRTISHPEQNNKKTYLMQTNKQEIVCSDSSVNKMHNSMDLFHSADSFGSLKYDFVELFRSGSTFSSGAPLYLGDSMLLSGKPTFQSTSHSKTEVRSRSSSLETNANDSGLHLDLSICPLAAASLADAGRVAEEMKEANKEEPALVNEEKEDQSTAQSVPCLSSDEEFKPDDDSDAEDALDAEYISPAGGIKSSAQSSRTRKRQVPKSEKVDDEFRLEPEDEETSERPKKKQKRVRKVYEPEERVYVEYTALDVLCQRGGLANSHTGNCRFREAKDKLQCEYFATPKLERTRVSQKLVDEVHDWKGRFLRKDSSGWYEVHNHVARTKAGQALRETYTPQERAAKRAKYTKKKKSKKQHQLKNKNTQ